jgi:hypothetical protein
VSAIGATYRSWNLAIAIKRTPASVVREARGSECGDTWMSAILGGKLVAFSRRSQSLGPTNRFQCRATARATEPTVISMVVIEVEQVVWQVRRPDIQT